MHPDVKRMLLQMRSMTAAARSICYATAVALDVSVRAKDAKVRADAAARGALLTPIAKAFSTDIGNEVAYLGVQIHGGMGFIEETGAAQHYRDARITSIYEGTNGIQSIDLVTRKLARQRRRLGRGPCSVSSMRHRQAGRDLERSGVSAPRAQSCATRIGSLERASKWLLERVPPRRTTRSPAPRPICACSARRSAAACSPAKRWPRRANGDGGDPQRYVDGGAVLCREHLGAGGIAGEDGDRERRCRDRRGCGAGRARHLRPSLLHR